MSHSETTIELNLKSLEWWIEDAERQVLYNYKKGGLGLVPAPLQPLFEQIIGEVREKQGEEIPIGALMLVLFNHPKVKQTGTALDDGFNVRPSLPNDLPETLSMPERLAQLLRIVWADVQFWRLVNGEGSQMRKDQNLRDYLFRHYLLDIDMPAEVWREMVEKPDRRAYLFALMTASALDWFYLAGVAPERGGRRELPTKTIVELLEAHLDRPYEDHRPALARLQLSADALTYLRRACETIAVDAAWCAKNPGRDLARRAPNPAHRISTYQKARDVEGMVTLLRAEPTRSDYALAWDHFETDNTTVRALAKEAKHLARLRDGLNIKQYKRRGA